MSQTLNILWSTPTPLPQCGYVTNYRPNGNPFYIPVNTVNTSGSTSGISSVSIPGLSPACYEGYVQSNCCASQLSVNVPFGINSYQPFYLNVATIGNTWNVIGTSAYPNPYPTLVTVTFYYQINGTPYTVTGSGTYPANVTTASVLITNTPGGSVLNYIVVNNMSPIFNKGGSLQQFDSVSTPAYFQFYNTSGCTSGTTSGCTSPVWNGSPLNLPSFILRSFIVTTTDASGNALVGNLQIQWIQNSVYNAGTGIYNSIIFTVYDPNGTSMGSIIAPFGVPGFNSAIISITKVSAPINPSTGFTLTTAWANTSLSGTNLFYLPNF